MTQSRRHSALESVANVVIGYSINFVANMLIFPLFGWNISLEQNLVLGAVFTVISLVRSYWVRRLFNRVVSVRAEPSA